MSQTGLIADRVACSAAALENPAPRARTIRMLKGWIAEGVLEAGMPLPTERQLSELLKVPRATVARAVQALEIEGLVVSAGGRTRLVATPKPSNSTLVRQAVVVLAPSLDPSPFHRQSGWTDWITQGVLAELRSRGNNVLTINPDSMGPADSEALLNDPPMGLVVPEVFHGSSADPAPHLELLGRLRKRGVPVVIYGGDPRLGPFDRVTSDHVQGAYELTRWLLAQGRRRPLLFMEAPADSYWQAERRRGYERAMREAGLEPLPSRTVPAFPGERRGSEEHFETVARFAAGHLIEELQGSQSADAILALSDGKVFPLARACRLLGKRVHEDVALVGYDNYYLDSWEREFEDVVPLATIDKRNFDMGRELARLLAARIAGELPPEPQTRVVAPTLVEIAAQPERSMSNTQSRRTMSGANQGEKQ